MSAVVEPEEDARQYLTLGAGGETYAAPVGRVREILDLRPISRMPRAGGALLGVIDVRGRSLPVLDLRELLGQPPGEDDDLGRIVVLDLRIGAQAVVAGLKTDRVFEVAMLDEGGLEAPPQADPRWRSAAVRGIGRREGAFVKVLDLDRLLDAGGDALAASAA